MQVYIEGKLRTRQWQDKDGNNRYTTEIVGDNLQMLGRKDENNANSNIAPTQTTSTPNPPIENSTDEVDDLPF